MMMQRYADAIRMFSHILVYVSRTKNFHQKNAQYDSITKKNEQMYALVAICVAFHPTRLDDTIHSALRDKYGEQFTRMQRGGPDSLPLFEELFRSACPKFITPTPPDFDNPEVNVDPTDHHLAVFMDEVKNNMWSPTVRSYLKLYTTMDLKKLAGFLEVEPDSLRAWLLVNKQRSRQVRWSEGGLLEGDVVNSTDLDYAMQGVSSISLLYLNPSLSSLLFLFFPPKIPHLYICRCKPIFTNAIESSPILCFTPLVSTFLLLRSPYFPFPQ